LHAQRQEERRAGRRRPRGERAERLAQPREWELDSRQGGREAPRIEEPCGDESSDYGREAAERRQRQDAAGEPVEDARRQHGAQGGKQGEGGGVDHAVRQASHRDGRCAAAPADHDPGPHHVASHDGGQAEVGAEPRGVGPQGLAHGLPQPRGGEQQTPLEGGGAVTGQEADDDQRPQPEGRARERAEQLLAGQPEEQGAEDGGGDEGAGENRPGAPPGAENGPLFGMFRRIPQRILEAIPRRAT
jgi:hypothetical protein